MINDQFKTMLLILSDIRVLLNESTTRDYIFDVMSSKSSMASKEVNSIKDFVKCLINLVVGAEAFHAFSQVKIVSSKLVDLIVKSVKLLLAKFIVPKNDMNS